MSGLRLPMQMEDAELRALAVIARGCELLLQLDELGLVEGGPTVNLERCAATIAAAQERGLDWTPKEAEDAAIELVREWNADPERVTRLLGSGSS